MCVPCALAAQTPALGPEFQANSYTTSYQNAPQVASDADGNFVVMWSGFGPSLGGYGVFARRFDNTGAPLGNEFVVNGFTAAHGTSIASNASGSFVVVWGTVGQDGSDNGVFAEKYDSSGTPQTGVLPVNTYTTGAQSRGRAAMDSAGNFVVVWDSADQDGEGLGVFGQRFDAAGNKLGSEFLVNTATSGHQSAPDIAMTPDGAFVVVWMSQTADPGEILGQLYDASGVAQGGEFPVNQNSTGTQESPQVAMDPTGNFVVAWTSLESAGGDHEAFARRFDTSGSPLDDEFLVAGATSTEQVVTDVAMDAIGAFTVVWDYHSPFTGAYLEKARRFDVSGRPQSGEYILNTDPNPEQVGASIALDSRGGFVAVWGCTGGSGTCPDGSASSVIGRRGGFPTAQPMTVDQRASSGTSNINGVLEAGETVAVDPAWKNGSTAALALTGTASNPSSFLTIDDASTDYGSIGAGATVDCYGATSDCLEITVSGPRPAAHWDESFDEALSSGVTKTWTLHIGESFLDVSTTQSFYAFIENLFHNRITGGCGGGNYCPDNAVTRGQMAVFLLKAKHGAEYAPPACAGIFGDVPCPGVFADWIEQLAAEQITGGCGGGNYCPGNPNTRGQMAVFLVKTFGLQLYGD